MTNTTGFAKLLVAAMLLAALPGSIARAQETPPPVEYLEPGVVEAPATKKYLLSDDLRGVMPDGGLELWDSCPAPPESSGTWLNRGWWSADIDAVVMIRKWDRDSAVLASDSLNSTFSPASLRTLQINRSSPAEGSARLNLGRFLFRDIENRDHTMEFTVFGGNEFLQTCRLESDTDNNLAVNVFVDNLSDVSFDGATNMDITYASRLSSFELNYKVASRLKSDSMELQPDGRWLRRATPGFTYYGVAGMRYIDLTETALWTAEDIINVTAAATFTGENGLYSVEANNDMFGFQGGGGLTYQSDRWSLTFYTKGGVMMNDAKTSAFLEFTDATTGDARTDVGFTESARAGSLPLMLQGGILARYHLRPNVSIRFGWEYLYLTAVTVAPHEFNFNPNDNKLYAGETPFYHGLTMGGEFYW